MMQAAPLFIARQCGDRKEKAIAFFESIKVGGCISCPSTLKGLEMLSHELKFLEESANAVFLRFFE